ncbi:uncharacterized protein LOC116349934 [Contarinia nasturtii]|uniref:uncharacterized protein LOC116349934 n=1 Tax=Contarinia nasturtii TaxID=265458 RepID=UPI0012D37299|nr:uncharacterized protein LOC116349934 [Contarinia nasturtii]XP_031637459.1 uncharacterized protein LOC116349934 [Contarinia nasturtii]
MQCYVLYYTVILTLSIFEANTQDFGRSIFNIWKNSNIPQNSQRQGSIDEFIALRPTTPKPNEYEPCIPQQFFPRRDKRSPHFRRIAFQSNYPVPVNVYQQNVVNKPSYNGYGGYYCGNHQPGHNNYLTHFPNLFGGIFGTNSNAMVASPLFDANVKPVHENNGDNINPNGIDQWKPGKPVGGIQNIVDGHNQDLSSNRFPKFF